MTAITTTHSAGPTRPDSLLRFAMRADATVCAGARTVGRIAADPLSRVSGLSAASEWIAGAALVGYGVAALLACRSCPSSAASASASSSRNVVFAVVVVAVLVGGRAAAHRRRRRDDARLTVASRSAFAYLQYLGVRRLA